MSIFKVPPSIVRAHAVKMQSQVTRQKWYVPVAVFGQSMRYLRLSWKTSTQAKAYAQLVLDRYSAWMDVDCSE